MAIITYPLDGIDYNASNAETYLCTRTSGVFSADGQFQARVYGNRQVEISSGLAWIQNTTFKGKSVCNTSPVIIDVPLADGSLPRKDRIVLRFDKAENLSKIILLQGEASSAAKPPAVQRTEQVYDLGLCVVDVPPSSLTVLQQHITSTLLDESVCGLMRDGVTGIPTAQLQEQVVALLADLRKAFEAQLKQQDSEFDASLEKQEQEFRTWFDTIKDIIGDDPLTQFADEILNLQNAVGGNAYFSGKGKSVTVRGYSGILGNVIAHGFTEQAGEGDPSPDNVREISVGGRKFKELTMNGEFPWNFNVSNSIKGNSCAVYISSADMVNYAIPAKAIGYSEYLKWSNLTYLTDAPSVYAENIFAVRLSNSVLMNYGYDGTNDTGLSACKAFLNDNPLKIWYEPSDESQSTGIYVPIETKGSEYRCKCVKINGFLCKENFISANGSEKRKRGIKTFNGSENVQYRPDLADNVFTISVSGVKSRTQICSHYKQYSGAWNMIANNSCQIVNNVFGFRDARFSTAEQIKAEFAAQYAAGTPVQIEYELSTESEYTHDPVEITAVPSGDGTFKVSADCELSVYQKNLQPVSFTGSYTDLKDKPTAADIGALGTTEKAASAKAADAASGYAFYMGYLNKNAGIEAQTTGVRLSWGKEYSYKLFFGQDPTYGDALCLHASSNGTYALGNSTARWASIYSTNGTIQTSDATRKEQITALGEKQLAFFEKLRPVSYKLKSGFDDAENHDRLHYGFIAQEVEQAMAECDISAMEFGGLCKDKEVVLAKTLNEDGTESVASKETGADVYSLRYQEFIALNTAAIQALKAEIAELKNQLNKLTEQLK